MKNTWNLLDSPAVAHTVVIEGFAKDFSEPSVSKQKASSKTSSSKSRSSCLACVVKAMLQTFSPNRFVGLLP